MLCPFPMPSQLHTPKYRQETQQLEVEKHEYRDSDDETKSKKFQKETKEGGNV